LLFKTNAAASSGVSSPTVVRQYGSNLIRNPAAQARIGRDKS
jgi:hypothetical protein